MLAAHAIIYVTEAAVEAVIASIRRSISGERPERHDIGLCDLQQSMNVLATSKPLFCQSSEVQGAKKRDLRKDLEDFISVPRATGDVVVSAARRLRVVEAQSGRLRFTLEEQDHTATGA